MTTLTLRKDGSAKNTIEIYNSLEKLKKAITRVEDVNGKKFIIRTIKDGRKVIEERYEVIGVGVDQHDEALTYLRRLHLIPRVDEYVGDIPNEN